MRTRNRRLALAAAALAMTGLAVAPAVAGTAVAPYLAPVGAGYEVTALWSVGDRIPEAGDPTKQYQMIGIPDGLGGHPNGDGTFTLFMNHELTNTTTSEPVVGDPLNRGAFVSRLILDAEGNVLRGERAYDSVFAESVFVGPAADSTNSTPAFGRFCSGSVAGPEAGFDRPIFLTNEETTGSASFDGRGGQSVAIFDNEVHTLPRLGRFSKENTLVMPGKGKRTVIISLEDGPTTPDSQLYLYVGEKERDARGALAHNGLDNGQLYVFRSVTPGENSEGTFTSGTIEGEWVRIPGARNLTDAELEEEADARNAFAFVRPEDGAFNPDRRSEFFFVTTGGNAAESNELGRLYTLRLNPGDLLADARLHLEYSADQVIDAGGDTAISPDNVDVGSGYLMINEDGTTESRLVMDQKGRDGSVWRFPLQPGHWTNRVNVDGRERVAELVPPGRDGAPVGPGVWESSGVLDGASFFGPDAWLTDVQAHPPTTAPVPNTVEDGQVLLVHPAA